MLKPISTLKSNVTQASRHDVTMTAIVYNDDSRTDNQTSRELCLEQIVTATVVTNNNKADYQNCSLTNSSTVDDNCRRCEGQLVSDVNLANSQQNVDIRTNSGDCGVDIFPPIPQKLHLKPHDSATVIMSQTCSNNSVTKQDHKSFVNSQSTQNKQPTMNTSSSQTNNLHQSPANIKPFSSIPGPWPSLPFIGTGWQYFPFIGRYDLTKLHEAHIEKFFRYGPIIREEYQWGKSIVHIYDPVDFETVFRLQGRSPIRPPNEFVSHLRKSRPDRYPNVGISNLNGDEWFHHRHKLAPAIMKLKTINAAMFGQNVICDDFINYLWSIRDRGTNVISDIQEAAYRFSLESICMMCLDSRIGSFDCSDSKTSLETNDGDKLIEATKMLFDSFNKLYYGLPFWKFFNTTAYNELERAESTIHDIASKYVDKAIESLLDGEKYNNAHSVLQTMLNTKGLMMDDIKIAIIDFISGGIFTVSNTLVYLIYHLAANGDVQEKLFEEIEHVMNTVPVDEGDAGTVVAAHIAQMPYLKACVRECFRLSCPVPGIMRVTSQPMILSGYHIPANTVVFSHLMSTCRLEQYFKDAHQFRPERWIDPIERSQTHPFALLPFGFGNRMCVGKRFSETEIYLAITKLILAFQIELVDKKQELELKHAFIVIPAHPISLHLTPRSGHFQT